MDPLATATAGGGSNDKDGAVPDAKDGGAEVIGVDSNDEDCGADGRVFIVRREDVEATYFPGSKSSK